MPHVVIKLFPGRTEEQKAKLADRIVEAMKETINATDKSISIAFEEVAPEDWVKKVYEPEIAGKENTLFRKPGYKPSDI